MKRYLIGTLLILCAGTLSAQHPVARPWLGMALTVRESPTGSRFLYVGQVGPETPAAKAGIRAGDIITRFGRTKPAFRDNLDVIEFVSRLTIGRKVQITLTRAGSEVKTSLVVGRLPAEYESAWQNGLERARKERAAANQ